LQRLQAVERGHAEVAQDDVQRRVQLAQVSFAGVYPAIIHLVPAALQRVHRQRNVVQ
jgi:hypothetical protein